MGRTWGPDGGGIPLSAANLNAMETDIAKAVKTAVVNYPPLLEASTTGTTNTFQWRGTSFVATQSGTVTQLRNRLSAVSGRTYTLGIYELSKTDRVTVAAVTGTVTVTAASSGDLTLTAACSIPIVAGKIYALMGGQASGALYDAYYNNTFGQTWDSAVSTCISAGGASRGFSSGVIGVGSVLAASSDYFYVGMTVDY